MKKSLCLSGLVTVMLLSGCDERAFYFYSRAFGHGLGYAPGHDYDPGQEELDQQQALEARRRARDEAERAGALDVVGAEPDEPGLPARPGGSPGYSPGAPMPDDG